MKRTTLLLFMGLGILSLSLQALCSELRYYGQGRSLIQWDELDPKEFLDFTAWKLEQDLKERSPRWETVLRERSLTEVMGRALECSGQCRVYKGERFNSLRFRSALHQGDEVVTEGDSYLWIYFVDGTLMRLSPETSVTLKELNIGVAENFLHVRINSGNVLWLSRTENQYLEKDLRETDTLFLPLDFFEANPFVDVTPNQENGEEDLFASLKEPKLGLEQTKRLNTLIQVNNSLVNKKKTHSFAVMPNGTVYGVDMNAEFIVLLGDVSYVKQRSPADLSWKEGASASNLTFFFRGYENTRQTTIQSGQWYHVDVRGRTLEPHEPISLFGMGEFITSQIPTIYIARELLLNQYSRMAFEPISPLNLAQNHGYRQWGKISERGSDLNLRLEFLKEHTRRVETTNLLTATRFRERLESRGESLESMVYSNRFFSRALVDFRRNREVRHYLTGRREEILNSTQNPLWQRMHAKPQRPSLSPTF
jgi:hypothetical protein